MKTGVRFESFNFVGKMPLFKDLLKRSVIGQDISEAISFRSRDVKPSGPGLLDGSKFFKILSTSFAEITTLESSRTGGTIGQSPGGRGSLQGLLKTELK